MSLEQKTVGTVINCSTFRHRAGNNAKYIREQIDMFQRVYPRQLEQLRHATKGGDAERLRAAAHTLKGTLGNFAAEPAMRATAALEEKGSQGDLSGVDECYYAVEYEVDRLCDTLMSTDMGGAQ